MRSQQNELKVFDWDKAARLIVERAPKVVGAGLEDDWEWTGGEIFENGRPLNRDETYTYLASTHATPQIEIDGELLDCYIMQSSTPGWDSHTFWPESALSILNSGKAV